MAEENNFEKLMKQYPETLIAQQQGNFYRMYEDSAYIIHALTEYKLNKSEEGTVHAGFPIEHPEKALKALRDNRINYKFFRGDEIVQEEDFGEDNRYAENVRMYSGENKPTIPEKNKAAKDSKAVSSRQQAVTLTGVGQDTVNAMNDLLAQIEKLVLKDGSRVNALSATREERNGGIVQITGIVIYTPAQ